LPALEPPLRMRTRPGWRLLCMLNRMPGTPSIEVGSNLVDGHTPYTGGSRRRGSLRLPLRGR
jgi:hypothetical protein